MKLFAAELDFRAIAREFELPETFSEVVHHQAAAARDRFPDQRVDMRDVDFVTIDPPRSQDLDQAVFISPAAGQQNLQSEHPAESGWHVLYAIADVAAFIEPGSELEKESLRRGQTMYLPDDPVRLHPVELSEDRASLLPGQDRPAVVWDIHVAADGEVERFTVYRAIVRSRAKLNYEGVEADRLAGTLHPAIRHLPQLGKARQHSDRRRNAINLRLPSIAVETAPSEQPGEYQLRIEPRHVMNDYNAELSLLAGMCAGQMMVEAGVGILRTLPQASAKEEAQFDSAARALGFIRGDRSIGELLADINASTPQGMALMQDALKLLRGAGYVALGVGRNDGDSAGSKGSAGVGDSADRREHQASIHAGIGGFYAHVTAPLRRLSDRYSTEVCLCIAAGKPVEPWVYQRLEQVVDIMEESTRRANQVDRACMRLTEAVVLRPWIGQNFEAAVLHTAKKAADVFITEPPVIADCVGTPQEASQTLVTLITADPQSRTVEFAWPAD